MDGQYIAYVDRIVDERSAVLLLEENGETVGQRTVDVAQLPPECRHERAFCEVTVDGSEIYEVSHRPDIERERRERIKAKAERLANQPEDLDPEDFN